MSANSTSITLLNLMVEWIIIYYQQDKKQEEKLQYFRIKMKSFK